MKDRFKFRVWLNKLNRYSKNTDNLLLSEDGNVCEFDTVGCYSEKDVVIQQSTGLKDKNGKLIYEGDILKVKGKQTDETIGFIEWLNDFGKFSLNIDSCCIYTDFDYLPENEREIIGNIYENKELLEEQK